MWPSSNLAAIQRRLYCAAVNSHSPVGLVRGQWDTTDWACVLCDCRIHDDRASTTMRLPILQLSYRLFFFGKASHHPDLSAPLQPRFGSLRLLALPKAKDVIEREEICECKDHTVHKLSQRYLTADWLALRENDCLRMRSKGSSNWLPSYIKAT
jgi:hypothetical protein